MDQTLIDKLNNATNEFLGTHSDWALNMEIVDTLMSSTTTTNTLQAVLKWILKRMDHKNPEIGILAIVLLETLVKNMSNIHPLVHQQDYLDELVKLGAPQRQSGFFSSALRRLKSEDEMDIKHSLRKDKIMALLQTWAFAFDKKKYPRFMQLYQQLRSEGIGFPSVDEDAPIFVGNNNNQSSASSPKSSTASSSSNHSATSSTKVILNNHAATAASAAANSNNPNVSPSGLYVAQPSSLYTSLVNNTAALRDNECIAMRENALLLFDVCNASEIGTNLSTYELVPELVSTLKGASARIGLRLSQGNASENVLMELIAMNDLVNEVLQHYEGLNKGTKQRVRPDLVQEELEIAAKKAAEEKAAAIAAIPKLAAPSSTAPSSAVKVPKLQPPPSASPIPGEVTSKRRSSNSNSSASSASFDVAPASSSSADELDFLSLGSMSISSNKLVASNAPSSTSTFTQPAPVSQSNKPTSNFFFPPPPSDSSSSSTTSARKSSLTSSSTKSSKAPAPAPAPAADDFDPFAELAERDVKAKPAPKPASNADAWDAF